MSIDKYIKSKEKFSRMPFSTVYAVIVELISDGYIDSSDFEQAGDSGVAVHKQKSTRPVSGGLHSQSNFHGNRQRVGRNIS